MAARPYVLVNSNLVFFADPDSKSCNLLTDPLSTSIVESFSGADRFALTAAVILY